MSETDVKFLEERIKQLKHIYYLEQTMFDAPDLNSMLNIVLKDCIALTEATSGSIMFRDEDSDQLYFCAYYGHDQEIINSTQMKIGDGITGTTIRNGFPQIINNISLDPKYITLYESIQSEMSVPLTIQGFTLGAITLDNIKKNSFTDWHLELIQMIAGYSCSAINYFLEKMQLNKLSRILQLLLDLPSIQDPQHLFVKLAQSIQVQGARIINKSGTLLYEFGLMADSVIPDAEIFNDTAIKVLLHQNNQISSYIRLTIPCPADQIVFIADKNYYCFEDKMIDLVLCRKILEILFPINSSFQQCSSYSEYMNQWASEKMSEPSGNIYNNAIAEIEALIISKALNLNNYNKLKTACFLGINRNTLLNKMNLYNL